MHTPPFGGDFFIFNFQNFNSKPMRNSLLLATLLFFFTKNTFSAQETITLLSNDISIRAIELYKGRVYYAGSKSKMGYVDYNNPKIKKSVVLSSEPQEFRTLGRSKSSFYAVNILSPATFYEIDGNSLESKVVFKDTLASAFYDALHFISAREGLSFSDSPSTMMQMARTTNFGKQWHKMDPADFPAISVGEAAFAASNNNIVSKGKTVWLATGGKKSRIFKRTGGKWSVVETPIIQGESSQGMYALDFYNKKIGFAAGGDYTKQKDNIGTMIKTADGGRTWVRVADGKNPGYTTVVKYRPGGKGQQILAVGDSHVSLSRDGGESWETVSSEMNMYTAEWINRNWVVMAGRNKIVKIWIP